MKQLNSMKVLFIGDIVGKSGRNALFERLPFLKEKYQYDILIVNGENSAHGKGITRKIYDSFVKAGVDCITMGNHTFSKDMIYDFIESADRMIRPANMIPLEPGKPVLVLDYEGYRVGIFNIYGSVFMDNVSGNPMKTMERLIEEYPCDIRIVDFHGEATSEKYAFMLYFRKKVQMVVGTHTHIQTADEAIYDNCAFICDVGMTGAYDSILGRDSYEVINMFYTDSISRYTISENPGMLSAVCVDIDVEAKKAVSIERIQIKP